MEKPRQPMKLHTIYLPDELWQNLQTEAKLLRDQGLSVSASDLIRQALVDKRKASHA